VSNVQAIATRTTASIDEERFAFFVVGKDFIEVAMAEEEASSEPAMWCVTRETLEALEQCVVYQSCLPFPARYALNSVYE